MIRDITPADESALARFFTENDRVEITQSFHPFPLSADSARRIASEPRRDCYFSFWNGDAIVGMAMLRGWDEGYEVPSFGVMVDHRFHGRGIGHALMEHALDEARRLACSRVRLTVYESNTTARQWYERAGFRASARNLLPDGDARLTMFCEFAHE